jgi:hypothetical protein
MASASQGSQPAAGETPPESEPRKLSQFKGEIQTGSLQHLFGPAVLIVTVSIIAVITVLLFWGIPDHPTKMESWVKVTTSIKPDDLKPLFDHQLKEYKAGLLRLDAYLALQALFIATTVLVIIRRSDSLTLFGNSIPLSWLHFFIPILLVYLWLASGFIVHDLVWGRMRGVEISNALHGSNAEYKKLFRDSGWIDGWLLSFVDNRSSRNYSGIDRDFATPATGLLIVILGTLISAAHASTLALVSIGCRRYLNTKQRRRLLGYYILPTVPLAFLLISHFLFAYGGPNRNSFQLYVAVVSTPLLAFLLWLSAKIDSTSYPETLQCLRRLHQVTLLSPIDRFSPEADGTERTIALIGDSLSTGFHVSSVPQMLVRMRRGWKTNWFLTLPADGQVGKTVLMRLNALGTITGVQHASVSALVINAKHRRAFDHLAGTYHFSHQVDEVLTGRFPDILLLWIGNNDVDWRWQSVSRTRQSLLELSNAFIRAYEAQLRRLLDGALGSESRAALIVFGLANFESFFRARAEAEAMRRTNNSLFPHLESSYSYFVSMKPEYRSGMIELAALFNDKLEGMCKRLGEQLQETNVRLIYSNALSVARMDSPALLNSVDAWHASMQGHSRLADSAYPIVYEQAHFLNWCETDNP